MVRRFLGKGVGLILFAAAQGVSGLAGSASKPQESAAPASQNGYVSSATCASCHEELATKFARNPHQILETDAKKGWKDQSCESCHGPGQAHVDAGDGTQINAYSKLPARDANRQCLTC